MTLTLFIGSYWQFKTVFKSLASLAHTARTLPLITIEHDTIAVLDLPRSRHCSALLINLILVLTLLTNNATRARLSCLSSVTSVKRERERGEE